MNRKIYNKLVRDKIPELIKERGGLPKVSKLGQSRFREELKKKLVEESKELLKANHGGELLDELSDVLQVTKSIAKEFSIPLRILEEKKNKKRRERGAFEKRLFLEYVKEQ